MVHLKEVLVLFVIRILGFDFDLQYRILHEILNIN